MLKKLFCSTIIVLSFVMTTYAQLEGPPPSLGPKRNPPQAQTTDKHQKPESDKRGTEEMPFVIKIISTPKSQAEIDQKRQEHKEKASQNWWLVRFTGLLFAATVLLAIFAFWQGYQMRRSVNSLITSERANLFVRVQHPVRDGHYIVTQFAEFTVINVGRTPAILTSVNGSYEKIPHGDPIPRISSQGDHEIVPNTIIIGTIPEHFRAIKSHPLTRDYRLICIGRIQYKDIFEVSHETGFCWERIPHTGEFEAIKDAKCNYHT